MKADESRGEFTPEQIAQRRDTLLLQLLKTPPKPRTKAKQKLSRPKPSSRKTPKTG
jgi:hypothetical protein